MNGILAILCIGTALCALREARDAYGVSMTSFFMGEAPGVTPAESRAFDKTGNRAFIAGHAWAALAVGLLISAGLLL